MAWSTLSRDPGTQERNRNAVLNVSRTEEKAWAWGINLAASSQNQSPGREY